LKVISEQRAPREAVLTIDLDEADVEPYLDQAYRQAVRRLNIPGFRKGKAPRRILEQMFGREYLVNEALDSMIQDVTNKAVEQENLELGGIPSVAIEKLDPPTFIATVPLVPTVDLGAFESVRIEKTPAADSSEQVTNILDQLRQEQAVWEPAKGKVQMEDLLELTVDGWIDQESERLEILKSENTEYVPRPGTRFPIPGFDEGLVGLPQGKKTTFTVDVPDDFENKDYAGKKASFEVTIHQLKRMHLPELDDEFAKGAGDGFESMQALRDRVENELRTRDQRNADAMHQDSVLSKVVEGATFEMSPLIIEHELEHYVHERQDEFKAGRFTSIEDYQQAIAWQAMSEEELHESVRPQVEERLKRAHVLRELAIRQSFEAAEADIDTEVELMAADSSEDSDQIRALFQDPDRRDSLGRVLTNRKILQYLSDMAIQSMGGAAKPKARAAAKPKVGSGDKPAAKKAAPKRKSPDTTTSKE
jgi:trigger factor